MDFLDVDAAPTDELNRILWHTAKGWETPYPGVKHSLFFPMAVDLADEERETEPEAAAERAGSHTSAAADETEMLDSGKTDR
jgi:hypothetical protein